MQIQDFSDQHSHLNNSNVQDLRSNIFEVTAASLIFILPILVLFALSVNQ